MVFNIEICYSRNPIKFVGASEFSSLLRIDPTGDVANRLQLSEMIVGPLASAGAERRGTADEGVPQRLKPECKVSPDGTGEPVPLNKAALTARLAAAPSGDKQKSKCEKQFPSGMTNKRKGILSAVCEAVPSKRQAKKAAANRRFP